MSIPSGISSTQLTLTVKGQKSNEGREFEEGEICLMISKKWVKYELMLSAKKKKNIADFTGVSMFDINCYFEIGMKASESSGIGSVTFKILYTVQTTLC